MWKIKPRIVAKPQKRLGKLFGAKCTYPDCNKVINSPYYMKAHIERVHQATVKYPCPFCDTIGDSSKELTSHMSIHLRGNTLEDEQIGGASDPEQSPLTHPSLEQELGNESKTEEAPTLSGKLQLKSKEPLEQTKPKDLLTEMFKCKHCRFTSTIPDLQAHMETHRKERLFPCNLCFYRSTGKYLLLAHMRTHSAETSLKCDFCDFRASYKNDIRLHSILCHEKESQPEGEDGNSRGVRYKKNRKLKPRATVQPRPGPKKKANFKCRICFKAFPSWIQVAGHMRVHPIVGREKTNLNLKLSAEENPGPSRQKDANPVKTGMKKMLHIVGHQPGEAIAKMRKEDFKCFECCKTFSSRSNLRRHLLRIHATNEREKKVVLKSRPSVQMETLSFGNKKDMEKQYSCNLCKYTASKIYKINDHKKSVHFASKTLSCSECDSKFGYNAKLKRHMEVHSLERKYPCPFCTHRHWTESKLQSHCTLMHKDSANSKLNGNVGTAGPESVALLKKEREEKEKQLLEQFKCRPCFVKVAREEIENCPQ